jgi:hypothetical protein
MSNLRTGAQFITTVMNAVKIMQYLIFTQVKFSTVIQDLKEQRKYLHKKTRSIPWCREMFLVCHWAMRELGLSATAFAKKQSLSHPAVTISVKRGEKMAKKKDLKYWKSSFL